MKAKLCILLALVLVCAVAAPAVSLAQEEPVTISFWTLTDRQNAYQPISEAYMAEHPNVKIELSYYDTDGIKDACKVAAASGTLPDLWFNWGGSLGGYYVKNGCTYNLNDYAAANNWNEIFNPAVLSLCTLDGQLSGYPEVFNVLGVYYNKATFAACGVEPPTTFEELEAVCAKLKENGVVPFSTAGLYGWHVMRILEQFIEYYAGAELHDQLQAMTTSWDCEAVVKSLAKFEDWCQKGYFPDGFLTNDPNDTILALATGAAACDLQGQWYDGSIISNELDIGGYSWFPFPNGTGRMSAFGQMQQINANTSPQKLEVVMDYLNYLFTNEHAADPEYSKYLSLPLPRQDATLPAGQPNVATMYEYAGANGTFTITDQAFPTVVADVLFDMQDALYSGTTTPEAAAAAIEAAVQAYLAQ